MSKLIMTKGLPGSGKTTWAKSQNAYRINKDDLRSMMNNGVWSKINEKYILLVRDAIIQIHLKDKNDVIVDDTNLASKHEERLRELAKEFNAEFEIKDFTDIPLEECIKRDQKRPNYVGEKVIRQMYKQFLKPKNAFMAYNATLPFAIICDIDGTLALFGDKNPYDREFIQDDVNDAPRHILQQYRAGQEGTIWESPQIILFSGRKDIYAPETKAWLSQNAIPYDEIYMRKENDTRKDFIIKKEMYEEHVKGKYNVLFVLDDRNQVVELWRNLGLTCLQVADGDF